MKTLITRASAHVRGRLGQRKHSNIVDNVFKTRDQLDASRNAMLTEIAANDAQIRVLRARNKTLYTDAFHSERIAHRIAEFFSRD